ncbi:MAG: transketolase, partial [Rhodothermales bacterium]|nr:transketolase [Rhodothermales bacterium]
AASLAGHLGLGKLIYLYDDNHISIEGDTNLTFTEDVSARFESYGWHVQKVADGNDLGALDAALNRATEEEGRPSLISVRTIIGYGSPNKQNTSGVHGSPLGPEEVVLAKRTLGWPEDQSFFVPDSVYTDMNRVDAGNQFEAEWNKRLESYSRDYPEEALELERWISGDLPGGLEDVLPVFESGKGMATRASSGKVLDALAGAMPNLIGGSADLAGSNKTEMKARSSFQADAPQGSLFHFGVREHGMASVCNGMFLHGGVRPFCATFLVFTDYLRPALRLSALMKVPVIYVMTHDSIGLGEDGPTHQPVEHYMSIRVMPNVNFIRPGDANETVHAWKVAIESTDRPTVLALSRQGVPTLDRAGLGDASGVTKGAYILKDCIGTPDVIVLATGTELAIALEATNRLLADSVAVRLVSMPCWRLFEEQSAEYRESVLPSAVTNRVSIEAGVTLGWERYVGSEGVAIGIDRFGASGPAEDLYTKFGITPDAIVESVLGFVGAQA